MAAHLPAASSAARRRGAARARPARVTALILADLLDPSPDFGADPRPFVALMVIGFVIGVAGHVVRAKALVALGIGMVFLATFALPLAVHVLKATG